MTAFAMARWFGVVALLALSGCGQREPASAGERPAAPVQGWIDYTDAGQGYNLSFPESWHRAAERMSRISEPREMLSLATVPLSWRRTDCEAFAGAAGISMGPRDVVLTVWERGYDRDSKWSDFPRRPPRFGPVADAQPARAGCGEPAGTIIHWRNVAIPGATSIRWSGSAPMLRRTTRLRSGTSSTPCASTPTIDRTGPPAGERPGP
jgi:hypothetical protein